MFCEECPASQADKAADVRAAIEQAVGKPEAKCILQGTRTTVARCAVGSKQRILCVGDKALRLMPLRGAPTALPHTGAEIAG